jgi:hypothetical protein
MTQVIGQPLLFILGLMASGRRPGIIPPAGHFLTSLNDAGSSEGVRGEGTDWFDGEAEQSIELGAFVLAHELDGVAEVLLGELLHERGEETLQSLRCFVHRAPVLPVARELLLYLFELDAGGPEDEGLFLRVLWSWAYGAPHRDRAGGGINGPEDRRFG